MSSPVVEETLANPLTPSAANLTAAIGEADESQLVATAREAVSRCSWVIGQCAAAWTERYAAGRTDGDFAELVGLSADQVYQRRRVWETFADVRDEYAGLRWSHFYAAVAWDDAPDALSWAEEMGATVAEMRAWRRGQRGEDLTQPAEPDELPPFEATGTLTPQSTTISLDAGEGEGGGGGGSRSESDEPTMAVARQTGEGDYVPFRPDARGDGGDDSAEDKPLRPLAEFKKIARSLERMSEQLSGELLNAFYDVPGDVQDRVLEAFDDVRGKLDGLK